ncbi:hypothetical protein IMSAGC003_03061 [Lachnospiraceae bacterium]|nr:hypothetical protein IMSAGC003_03061 [Lachnospiraceae bacterium]
MNILCGIYGGVGMDYESCYYASRSRYYDACSEITNCENRANELRSQKQQKISLINQLKAELKRNEEALLGLSKAIKADVGLHEGLSKITTNMNAASENLLNMAIASSVQNKSLSSVYSAESSKTQNTLNNIFSSPGNKNKAVENKISELQESILRAESELRDIEAGIRSAESAASDWRNVRRNASCDMDYYRRRMQEEE